MTQPTLPRVLSPESAVGLIAGFVIASIDMNSTVRSLFVLIAVGLVAYVSWTMGGPIWRRITLMLVGSAFLIVLSWPAIQHDLARERLLELLKDLKASVPLGG
jgi:membrane protein implicated in regulation of membrane protease activity